MPKTAAKSKKRPEADNNSPSVTSTAKRQSHGSSSTEAPFEVDQVAVAQGSAVTTLKERFKQSITTSDLRAMDWSNFSRDKSEVSEPYTIQLVLLCTSAPFLLLCTGGQKIDYLCEDKSNTWRLA